MFILRHGLVLRPFKTTFGMAGLGRGLSLHRDSLGLDLDSWSSAKPVHDVMV